MLVEVFSKRLSYRLAIKGKYTVIQGDSGNGKTNLCLLLHARQQGNKTIKVKCDVPVIAFNPESIGAELKQITGSVIVIDEEYLVLKQHNTASILQESDNYFIIISRKPIDYLPLCIENLYEMQTSGREHCITPKIICKYKHSEFIPDLQIVNDNAPRRMEI